jgi:PAS domain S-box-containing protein
LLASILLMDEDGVHLRHGAAPSLPEAYNRAIDGIEIGPNVGSCGTAAYRRQSVVVSDIATDPLWAAFKDLAESHGLRACWSTPVMSSRGQVLGTFALYYRMPSRPAAEDRSVVEILTRTCALAIEHKRAERNLADSEERFRSLSRCSPAGIFTLDTSGVFTYVNPKFQEYGNYEFEKSVEYWLENVVAPQTSGDVLDQWRAQVSKRAEFEAEFALKAGGGSKVVSLRAAPMTSAGGLHVGYVGTLEDVTERKQAERSLQHSEARLALALEAGAMGAWEWEVASGTVIWSPQLERLHGLAPGTFAGTFEAFQSDMNPEHRERVRSAIERALREQMPYRVEYEIVRPDGESRWLEARGRTLLDPQGNPARMIGICMDVTERHAAAA